MTKPYESNLHYHLPPTFGQDIDRFENEISQFKSGDLHPTAFTAKRVKMGIYQERNYQTFMCRIRCAANIITPSQLGKIAELAKRYGQPRVHVTTRAEVQIHHTHLDDAVFIIRELKKVGLSMKGGGGHTIRNIWTNHDSGIHPEELFDVQPYALALTARLIAEADSFELPRKFKTTFSSISEEAALSTVQDLGFVARIDPDGGKGFAVYVGGGLGAIPHIGILLHDFISADKVYHVAKALKKVFHDHGNRRNKHHSRIRFLVHDDLGPDRFRELYLPEFNKICNDDTLKLHIQPIDNSESLHRKIDIKPLIENVDGYETWYECYATPQKQQGLFSINLPLNLGDIDSEDCFNLEKILRPFGENVLRCSSDQNLHIRNIPEKYLKNVHKGLRRLRTLSAKPCIYAGIIPCTGAQTCQLGLNRPRPATTAIFDHLDKTDLEFDRLKDIRIHISGCPNACSNHWIGDLGFFGRVRRVQGRLIPTYDVLGGAKITAGETRLGERVGWVHARTLPNFLSDVLKACQRHHVERIEEIDFYRYWCSGGKDDISKLCKSSYNQIPTFEEDKNYYSDHGSNELFSVRDIGKAECAAGIYDMINVDAKALRMNLKNIKSREKQQNDQNLRKILNHMAFLACRMLMVTRGEEPKTSREIYDLFVKHFIESGLVNEKHRYIVDMVRDKKLENSNNHTDKVVKLAEVIIALYKTMDDTMRFPGETENLTINMEAKTYRSETETPPAASLTQEKKKPDRFKDLRGVVCPINFVKTKIELAAMKSGQTLEIYLDDGPPIENVPGSVQLEGHKILRQDRNDDYWIVGILKG